MSWRTISTRLPLSLAVVVLLACVAVVAVCLSTSTEPSGTPSSRIVSTDPCDSDDSSEAPAQVRPTSQSPPDATSQDPNEPNDSSDADVAPGPVDPPDPALQEAPILSGPGSVIRERSDADATAHPSQDIDPRGMVRGVLVDAEGNPVEGYVTLESAHQEPGAVPASSFAIPEPTHRPPEGLIGYAYNISGELARRFVWQKSASNEEMTIVLEPCASIVGQLVDSARKPVSSARLDLEMPMLDGRWRGDVGALDTPAVDDDGYFQFDRVPVGSKVRIAARRGTFSGQSSQIVLTPGQIAAAGQIVMTGPRPGAGLVQGRITDETGAPIADRSIMVRTGRRGQWLRTDAAGYYLLTELPTGRALTIGVEVKPYGSWSRVATPDDFACDFRLTPQGWSVVGEEAPPLFAARWFNHAPVTLSELRGRVVLLTFRKFERDADPGLSRLRNVQREYGPQGLTIIAAYDHLSVSSPLAADIVAEHLARMFKGLPIAGFLDTEPALVADLMPVERPTAAAAGATHWMYQVHTRPAFFLIDKTGIVQHVTAAELELRQWIRRLLDEEGVSPSP